MALSPDLPRLLQHLHLVPLEFNPDVLGNVVQCVFDDVEIPNPDLRLGGERDNALIFSCTPPTRAAAQMNQVWKGHPVKLRTSAGYKIDDAEVISGIERMSMGSAGTEVLLKCQLYKWTALQEDDSPCLWVSPAGFEGDPIGLWASHGNLHTVGFEQIKRTWNWAFLGSHTVFMIEHKELGWLVAIDTGSLNPPDPNILVDLTLIGFLIGHPLHLPLFHRISMSGKITGTWSSSLAQIGHSEKLYCSAVPAMRDHVAVDFFNKIMDALRSRPELKKLVLVPIGHHFESHGRSFESQFAHSWIALESLVARAEVFGLIQRDQELIADKVGWMAWVQENRTTLEPFAAPGCEALFINQVRQCFDAKPPRVQRAFKKLGIEWTPAMDEVGALRGEYIHQGGPRETGYKKTIEQINVLRTMLVVLYARLFGYDGPVADFAGEAPKEPLCWPAKIPRATSPTMIVEALERPDR